MAEVENQQLDRWNWIRQMRSDKVRETRNMVKRHAFGCTTWIMVMMTTFLQVLDGCKNSTTNYCFSAVAKRNGTKGGQSFADN